jgi:tRNA G37 N-methylase Trm5
MVFANRTQLYSAMNTATSTTPTICEPSLWETAFHKLTQKDKEMFPLTDTDKRDYLEQLVEATRKSRDVCQQNRLKVKFRGKEIIVRDVADKILVWIEKFKKIGDIAVQHDSGHAALPWAAVRLVLQVCSLQLDVRIPDNSKMGTDRY